MLMASRDGKIFYLCLNAYCLVHSVIKHPQWIPHSRMHEWCFTAIAATTCCYLFKRYEEDTVRTLTLIWRGHWHLSRHNVGKCWPRPRLGRDGTIGSNETEQQLKEIVRWREWMWTLMSKVVEREKHKHCQTSMDHYHWSVTRVVRNTKGLYRATS